MRRGRDDPRGLTARQVIEDIAAFPLRKEFDRDRRGDIVSGSASWSDGFAAFRNQRLAQEWLRLNPERTHQQKQDKT